ncbi:MAG: hypothetical protein WCO78_00565 [Candidatus Roizmanbacteria bacterium]
MPIESSSGLGHTIGTLAAPYFPQLLDAAHLWGIHVQADSQARLHQALGHLNEPTDPHLVVYFNHVTFEDPALALSVYRRYLYPHQNTYRQPFIPASKWNTDPSKNPQFAKVAGLAHDFLDCEIFPLIQPYMMGNEAKYGYRQQDLSHNFREFVQRLNKMASGDDPRAIFLAPEGTRSHDGSMGPAEPGIQSIVKKLHDKRPVCVLGMSISGDHLHRGINPAKPIDLRLTAPWMINPGDPVPDADYMMSRIADVHPSEKRGPYDMSIVGSIYQAK